MTDRNRHGLLRCRAGALLACLALLGSALGLPAGATPNRPSAPDPTTGTVVGPEVRSHRHDYRHDHPHTAPHWAPSATRGDRSPVPGALGVVFDSATHTIYVTGGTEETEAKVAVIDARTCNAQRTRCRPPVASITVDGGALDIPLIDREHHTLYAAQHHDGSVVAADLRHCTASDTTGCTAKPAVIEVGGLPKGLSLNQATHTLYVGNEAGPVTLVDTAVCNATSTTCPGATATVNDGDDRPFPYVDPATNTLYVTAPADNTLHVIDVSACRARLTSGCNNPPTAIAPTGQVPLSVAVDRRSGTLYINNIDGQSLTLVDYRSCNATNTTSCAAEHPTATTPPGPQNLVVDPKTRTLYVNSDSDMVAAIDVRTCSARNTTRCATRPRTVATGAQPTWIDLDPATGTLYVANHVDGDLQAIDARACSALRSLGCRHEAPTAVGQITELDPAHHTGYQLFEAPQTLGLLDTNRCNADRRSGCENVVRLPLGEQPSSASMDVATHTLYIVDRGTQALLVLDTARCNVDRHDGCAPIASIPIADMFVPGLNPVTHTVYVTVRDKGSIAVIDGAHCNAVDRSGCDQPPLMVTVGGGPEIPWVDPSTNTVYVSDIADNTVMLLEGAACDRQASTCTKVGSTAVGTYPVGLALSARRHTLAVANFGFGEEQGGISLVDTRHCRAADISGCTTAWPRAAAGRGSFGVHYDEDADTFYTANLVSASVSVIPADRCNTTRQDGCLKQPNRIAVGYFPVASYSDPSHHSLYVSANEGTSVIDTRRPCRSQVCIR